MSLTEPEVIDRMKHALLEAIQASLDLAHNSRVGVPYSTLRDSLATVEGCARQMGAFRGDARWLPLGMAMARCHGAAGGWLRGYMKNGVMIYWTPGQLNEAFIKLAAELRIIFEAIDRLATMKTGVIGPVLHETPPEERRFGRPALERKNQARGIILPPLYRKTA